MRTVTKKRKEAASGQSLPSAKMANEQKIEQEYQQKHNEYKKVLLNSYHTYDNQQAYEKTLGKILQEKIPALREIFSKKRFLKSENDNDERANHHYELSFYKIFLEFISTEEELSEERCRAILDWLNDNEIEEILTKWGEPQMIETLVATGNEVGVAWALEKYQDWQLLQIFNNQEKLCDSFDESIQETGNMKIINAVLERSKKILKANDAIDKEWREKLTEQINQISRTPWTINKSFL